MVLEQRIFDISGLQIQQRLAEQQQRLPLIFAASKVDVSTAVALMRSGAIHVLEKPLRPIELLDAIHEAVAVDRRERRQEAEKRRVKESLAMLTRKERQLVGLLASAKATKAISAELNICPRAVELRRRGVMEKLGLKSPSELLRFAMLAWQECRHCLDSTEPAGADCADAI
jgi:FixJ family two-component response regulator